MGNLDFLWSRDMGSSLEAVSKIDLCGALFTSFQVEIICGVNLFAL